MPLDPRARRLCDMLALSGAKAVTTAERRDSYQKLMAMAEMPGPEMEVSDMIAGCSVPLRLYREGIGRAALVFFHGGGLVAGSIETHDGMCRRLAAASGAVVISVGYRLAPEHRFPAGLDDAVAALTWIHAHASQHDIDRGRLAIGGDSAGALLATLITSGHCKCTVPLRAQLLLCPVVDLAKDDGSRIEFGDGFLIDHATIARDIADCFGSSPERPSPLRSGDLAFCPPTIIHSAACDPFRDEARELATALRETGIAVEFTEHPGMVHSFHGLPAFLPQAVPALDVAGGQLAKLLA